MQKVPRGPYREVYPAPRGMKMEAMQLSLESAARVALAEEYSQQQGLQKIRKCLMYLKGHYAKYRTAETDTTLLKFALEVNLTPHTFINNKDSAENGSPKKRKWYQ